MNKTYQRLFRLIFFILLLGLLASCSSEPSAQEDDMSGEAQEYTCLLYTSGNKTKS